LHYRQNKSIFIRDMEIHKNLNNSHILWLRTPKGMDPDLEDEDKVWVPLLPGYSILVKKGKYIKLSISAKNDRELQYSFENFGGDYTFTNLNEIRHYDHMFRKFKNELEIAELYLYLHYWSLITLKITWKSA
jgi:hypothetical protein